LSDAGLPGDRTKRHVGVRFELHPGDLDEVVPVPLGIGAAGIAIPGVRTGRGRATFSFAPPGSLASAEAWCSLGG
jgi:hypothetical protein